MNLRVLSILSLVCLVTIQGCASTQMDTSSFAATFRNGAVAADHPIASQAGAIILRQGGNAVDAAVATSFTLSVVRPYSCGLGGGGFMIIHLNNDPTHGSLTTALNYRERAPGAVTSDYYNSKADDASTIGAPAAGVPGTVAGLLYALDEYGTMNRATVLGPAIAAAEDGFFADAHYVKSMASHIERFERDPLMQERFAFVWKRFLRQGTLKVGSLIRNPEQASALRLIAKDGEAAFYEGPIARAIVSTIKSDGGDMTREDLADYFIREGKPVSFTFRGKTFLTMPPPSSGGVAIAQILGLLERNLGEALDERDLARTDPAYLHALTEAMKHAFADRARYMADPDAVHVPVQRLVSKNYLDARAVLFDASQTLAPMAYGTTPPPPDDSGTSHLSVVDANGSAVACTETINLTFGSLLAVDGFGFCLNNQMDDFTTQRGKANAFGLVQSDRNLPAPGKRPISSMSPTIVLDEQGRVEAVAGASGGPRIISATLEVLLNALLHGDSASQAVAAGRVHHQWMPDALWFERELFEHLQTPVAADSPSAIAALKALGHDTRPRGIIGNVQLIVRYGKSWQAASDPRKGGRPAGY